MLRSACAAFGSCNGACTSWSPCVLLCILLGLVSLPCVGRSSVVLLWCVRCSKFGALFSPSGVFTAASVRRRVWQRTAPCPPLWLSTGPIVTWVAPRAPGPDTHVSKSANSLVIGVCWGRFVVNAVHCCSCAFWAAQSNLKHVLFTSSKVLSPWPSVGPLGPPMRHRVQTIGGQCTRPT